jgi:hypothetical protein
MRKRPGLLTAVCIISIVLAAMGIMISLSSAVSMGIGVERIQRWTQSFTPPNPNPRMQELQDQMQQEIMAATQSWQVFNWIMLAGLLLLAVSLLIGAIQTLGLKALGRRLLMGVFVALVVLDVLRAIAAMSIQLKTQRAMRTYMPQLMESAAPPGQPIPPQLGRMMSAMTGAAVVFGIVIAVFWVALKIAFYLFGLLYLRRPAIRSLFEPLPPPAPAPHR